MVWKEVPSLYKLCVNQLTQDIWTATTKHCKACRVCSNCEAEKCLIAQNAVKVFSSVPQTVIESIYDKFYIEFRIDQFCKLSLEKNVYLIYLFSTLFALERSSSLKIMEFGFTGSNDCILFVERFGKCIKTLHYEAPIENFETKDVILPLCETLFQNANYIQAIHINYKVECTPELMEIIGKECTQLKELTGISVTNQHSNYDLVLSSLKSLFCGRNKFDIVRSPCCNTLESVTFDSYDLSPDQVYNVEYLNALIQILLQYVPNLRTIGTNLTFDSYLQLYYPKTMPVTNFKEIYINTLTNDLIPVLKKFSPKLKILIVKEASELSDVEKLSSFASLELLHFPAVMYPEIIITKWNTLRELSLFGSRVDVDIDVLASKFPSLVSIYADFGNILWKRRTYFKCLENVSGSLSNTDISFFASFANTVKHIKLRTNDGNVFNPGTMRQVILNVPFPNLEFLSLSPISYDFVFWSHVLMKLPKIRAIKVTKGKLYADFEMSLDDLKYFLKTNNLECKLL